jgi:hypothetical protein
MREQLTPMIDVARVLQAQAAELAARAREYADLGPSWSIHASAMQRLANGHYEMARRATEWAKAKQDLRRAADIVGRG